MDECCKEMVKWTYELCEQEIREEMERKYGARIRNLEQQLQEKRVTEVRWSHLLGQDRGRVKVYSRGPIMLPESCLS